MKSQQLHTVYFFFWRGGIRRPKAGENDGTRASDGASPHLVILVGVSHGISLTVSQLVESGYVCDDEYKLYSSQDRKQGKYTE